MLVRLGFLVAASIAAYGVRQVNCPRPTVVSVKPSENADESFEQHRNEEEENKQHVDNGSLEDEHMEEKEEEEEVKRISSIISPSLSNPALLDNEESMLPEFEDLLSGEIEFPLPNDKFDLKTNSEPSKDGSTYGIEIASNASELERLRNLVKELEEREVKLEGELLEYYGLKEQETDVVELQRQLKIKTVEIDMLKTTINSLQAERKKLYEEISQGASVKKELEMARNKIKELQRQIQLDANQTKGQLLMLKQQVSSLQTKEEEASKNDAELEKKLKSVKDLEVEVVELRRRNKELQHEKRELTVKLDAAEARITALSNMTEVTIYKRRWSFCSAHPCAWGPPFGDLYL